MAASPIEFHATGSRYIGGVHVESDWDFVAANRFSVRHFLEAWGFVRSPLFNVEEGYNDGFTDDVWELVEDGVKVQVQLTSHLPAKLYARDTIKDALFYQHYVSNTKSRIVMWNALCKAYTPPPALEFGSPEYMQLLFQ